ncbi:hypothetical protein [uncultured Bacteroides sp.]|nr:hypothetical protein [uncultured Bacteroides sp.]
MTGKGAAPYVGGLAFNLVRPDGRTPYLGCTVLSSGQPPGGSAVWIDS